ncbi:MAG: glycosyltransferase family 2 protein [Acidobacteriota bacterium]
MPRPTRVAVAILSWNGRRHLETCLPALQHQRDPGVPWQVIVLDNGSADDTVAWVKQHHPWVRLVESRHNLGFCGGVNRLVAAADDADAIALLNNDTRPTDGWLAALVDALAAAPDAVAAVSGKIVDWSGARLDFGGGAMTFDGHAFQIGYGRPLDEAPIPADGAALPFACGGNLLIWRDAFLAAGGFDEAYFAYLEDVDLGWRLWSMGREIRFAADAVVHHRSMATSDLLGRHHRGFLFERNAFLTAYKNYDDALWPAVMPAVLLAFHHRIQTLLVQSNPGGAQLTFDPYAGLIANTQPRRPGDAGNPAAGSTGGGAVDGADGDAGPDAGATRADGIDRRGALAKLRAFGAGEFLRRGVRKAARRTLPAWFFAPLGTPTRGAGAHAEMPILAEAALAHETRIVDGRTVAHLRAHTFLLGHLDRADADRRAVQARRVRPDADYFARFPAYLVPTYPGDDRLFASAGFASWLPDALPIRRAALDELVAERGADAGPASTGD